MLADMLANMLANMFEDQSQVVQLPEIFGHWWEGSVEVQGGSSKPHAVRATAFSLNTSHHGVLRILPNKSTYDYNEYI
jgi:hypothetical protein